MTVPIGLLLLCVSMTLAVGGLILVQRFVPIALRRQHNDVTGFIYAVLGVVYAVLLGLMVVAVWEQWNAAAHTADEEANSLAEIFWLADRMPESEGHHIQELARSYARVVVNEEWRLWNRRSRARKRGLCWMRSGSACRISTPPRQHNASSTNRDSSV